MTIAGATTTYSYDALNNLSSVSHPNGVVVTCELDGAGRRIGRRKVVPGGAPSVRRYLLAENNRVVAEYDGSGTIVSQFVYATRSHVSDYMIQGTSVYRLITDQLGSVRMVVNVHASNAAPSAVKQISYDAWGQITSESGTLEQPFGFAGGLHDRDTGLHFGAREYGPVTGRWLQKEPIGFRAGDTNLYAYAGDDPVNRVDPSAKIRWVEVLIPFTITLDLGNWAGAAATLVNLFIPGADTSVSWNGGNPVIILTNSPCTLGNEGFTYGHVVAIADKDQDTLKHKLAHIKQHDILGPSYIPVHAAAQGWSWLTTNSYDEGNPLETGPKYRQEPWPGDRVGRSQRRRLRFALCCSRAAIPESRSTGPFDRLQVSRYRPPT
jgi:RHS repeat-associated protein